MQVGRAANAARASHSTWTSLRGAPRQRFIAAGRETTAAICDLVWATDPQQDSVANLVKRLRERAVQQLEDTGIQLHVEAPRELPDQQISALARRNLLLILKEAINNVVKHAAAHNVTLRIATSPGELSLSLTDDGAGPPRTSNGRNGHGMTNMRRRAQEVGGLFTVVAAAGQGWTIAIKVPMDSALRSQ